MTCAVVPEIPTNFVVRNAPTVYVRCETRASLNQRDYVIVWDCRTKYIHLMSSEYLPAN